jgi:hypothetical protein
MRRGVFMAGEKVVYYRSVAGENSDIQRCLGPPTKASKICVQILNKKSHSSQLTGQGRIVEN